MTASPWKERPRREIRVTSDVMDFSGSATEDIVFVMKNIPLAWGNRHSSTKLIIKQIEIAFTEAPPSSPDGSYASILQIGDETSNTLYEDYTPGSSVGANDIVTIEQSDMTNPRVSSNDRLQIRTPGGASGSGAAKVSLVLSQDYTDWVGFDEEVG